MKYHESNNINSLINLLMKNFFTYGFFLLFLLGIGNSVSAATITALAPNLLTDHSWATAANWDSGTIPTYTDDVIIPQGDSISVTAAAYCQSVTVNGTLYTNSAFAVNGNITVNSGSVFSLNSNVYCKNVYNYGKFWNCNATNSGSKVLGVGFTNSGTSTSITASTDSITINNDGIFGWYRVPSVAGSKGCGFFIEFSNQAKALNITHTPGLATPFAFSVCGLFPYWYTGTSSTATSTAATQNLNVYINESIALVASASPLEFSLQNGDVFNGYNRTCNIASGDTVYVGGYFHTKAAAPSALQGNMTYNINGCLDMADANRSKNELDLYTSANSPYVSINVNSGGTLILGKAVNLVQSVAGQTTAINTFPNSTVIFGYTTAATTITVTNTTFPASLYNLSVATNTYSVTLPSSLRVINELTLTSGKVTLGSYNLTAGSISGGKSNSYVVTSGTGALSLNADATSGTLFPIGTATGYAPVTITPASNDTVAAMVSTTPTGAFTGYSVNSNEWTLTPQNATSATLALKPTTPANTNTPVAIFSGAVVSGNYATATTAALTDNDSIYTASGISLPAVATPYATGGSTIATAIVSNENNSLLIYSANKALVVKNATVGDLVTVYGISGIKVASSVVKDEITTITLTPGIYIVKAGSTIQKVSVQ